jgi:hypothetical protein
MESLSHHAYKNNSYFDGPISMPQYADASAYVWQPARSMGKMSNKNDYHIYDDWQA